MRPAPATAMASLTSTSSSPTSPIPPIRSASPPTGEWFSTSLADTASSTTIVGTANFGFCAQRWRQLRRDSERSNQHRPPDRFDRLPGSAAIVRRRIAPSPPAGAGTVRTTTAAIRASRSSRRRCSASTARSAAIRPVVSRREFAARCMAYLMLRAVGTLTPMSNPSAPAHFLTALLTADAGNWTSEGVFGGAYGKVLTWSFETAEPQRRRPAQRRRLHRRWPSRRIRLPPRSLGDDDGLEPSQPRRHRPAPGTGAGSHQLRLREDQEPGDIGRQRRQS